MNKLNLLPSGVYGYIYLITCVPNGKIYIGQSVASQGVQRRWLNHLSAANKTTTKALYAAIRKYGPDAFHVQTISEAITKESLDNLESLHIIAFDSTNPEKGYNRRLGGSHGAHSEESKQKMSQSRMGRIISPEWAAKIGAAQTGKKKIYTPEGLIAIRKATLGNKYGAFKRSDVTRIKMSESRKGMKFSPEHRANISVAAKLRYAARVKDEFGRFV